MDMVMEALQAAIVAGATSIASASIKDAYNRVKERISALADSHDAAVAIKDFEHGAPSNSRQLSKILATARVRDDPVLLDLTRMLLVEVRAGSRELTVMDARRAYGPVGTNLGTVNNNFGVPSQRSSPR